MNQKDSSICKQVATETTAVVCEKLGQVVIAKDFIKISNKFGKWIVQKGDNKETLICRQAALRRAAMSVIVCELDTTDKVLEFAETLYNYY
jgi:hypothetical protein